MTISFIDLTPQSWEKYSGAILDTEKCFPESIQSTKEDYINALAHEGVIAKIILYNDEFAGAGICLPFTQQIVEEYEIYDTQPLDNAIYLYSIAVKEGLQGKGIGLTLLKELTSEAKAKGYKVFAGHYRPNGSLQIIKKLGAKELKNYPNWSNSNEEYVYCELDI